VAVYDEAAAAGESLFVRTIRPLRELCATLHAEMFVDGSPGAGWLFNLIKRSRLPIRSTLLRRQTNAVY